MNACSASAARVRSEPSAPPPSSTTATGRRESTSSAASSSSSRNAGSPRVSNSSATDAAGSLLDDRVDRDELPAEPLGELRAERRLPGAHEADERDVTA